MQIRRRFGRWIRPSRLAPTFGVILALGWLTACASPAAGPTLFPPEASPSASAPAVTSPPMSPSPEATPSSGGCRPFSNAELHLAFNDVNQVRVAWSVEGGCPPFSGTLVAWYQDELHPSATYVITEAEGRLLDPPIILRGTWDRDYYLTLSDAVGHRVHVMQTITIGG